MPIQASAFHGLSVKVSGWLRINKIFASVLLLVSLSFLHLGASYSGFYPDPINFFQNLIPDWIRHHDLSFLPRPQQAPTEPDREITRLAKEIKCLQLMWRSA